MVTLENWFQEKDYEEGLLLLAKHSKNRMLVQNLTKKSHPGKLEYELKKVASQLKVKVIKKLPVKVDTKPAQLPPKTGGKKKLEKHADQDDEIKLQIIRGKKTINPDDLPEEIKKLWDFNRDSYKEIRSLHEKLKLMGKAKPEDRQPLTDRATYLDDQIRTNWEVIDAWKPGKKAEVKKDDQKIDHKRINANRKYISTNLKKLQLGMDAPKAELLRDNLKIRLNELLDAGEKLNQDTIDELTKAGVI